MVEHDLVLGLAVDREFSEPTASARPSTLGPANEAMVCVSVPNKAADYFTRIVHLQAWYRGVRARRKFAGVFRPNRAAAVIKYIDGQFKNSNMVVEKLRASLGPYCVMWDGDDVPEGTLQLRKAVVESKTRSVYVGYWNTQTEKKEGYGQELYANGSRYEGTWKFGEYNGEGRYIDENGNCYTGTWVRGKANGLGTFISAQGMRYMGEWRDSEHHGKGTDRKIHHACIGKESWADGSTYEGEYVRGEKKGKGRFVWPDGSCYEGDFVASKMLGKGASLATNIRNLLMARWTQLRWRVAGQQDEWTWAIRVL